MTHKVCGKVATKRAAGGATTTNVAKLTVQAGELVITRRWACDFDARNWLKEQRLLLKQ